MKRKRTSPQKQTATSSTSTTNRTLSQPESPDVIEIDVEDANKQPQSVRRSWVWLHFEETEDRQKAVCQVIMKNNQKCGSTLKKDQSSSTKNFHNHLEKVHKLIDPKASKKIDKSQTDLARWAKSGKVAPKTQLNQELLKTAIVYFLAEADLSFKTVEKPSFKDLMRLMNKEAMPLMERGHASDGRYQLKDYGEPLEKSIKLQYLSKQDCICFTQDAWTAPNMTAFMAVTAHFVNEKFQLIDLTLAIPNVQGLYSLFPQPLFQLKGLFFLSAPLGEHTGKNFADLFYGVLSDYKLLDKLHTITADNASTNGRTARELQILLPSFNTSTNLLGCVAHVINLGAKAGMAVLGGIEDDGEEEEISMVDDDSDEPHPSRSVMRISNLTSTPDGVAVNL
ncbi:hypothetical protein PSHT_02886 [Puccinia striiformis]|uniref:BED-type domain-containing protein n=1 Tax=Puccinia striiformis TaxID=27350 RepID=A0A2S4WGT2_9BASI|nr:hypothetical protein PSHT_02886 [Puccinia striiformis]